MDEGTRRKILTPMLQPLGHIDLSKRGTRRMPIGARYFPWSRSMKGGKVSKTPTARSTKAATLT